VAYRLGQKMAPFFAHIIISPNINRFSKFSHCQNQETICNKTIIIDPTTPQVCRYTTLWNVRLHTQAGDTANQRWSSLTCGHKQSGLKSGQLCCLGCSSTDSLLMLTIHDSQPAEAGVRHWVGQTAAAFGSSRHWSVASPSWMRRPAAKRTH